MEKVIVILIGVAIFWSAVYYIKKYQESKKSTDGSKGSGGGSYPGEQKPQDKPKK